MPSGIFITAPGAVEHELSPTIMVVSSLIAVAGILLAWIIYQKQLISAESLRQRFAGIYNVLYHKFYIDEIYAWLIAVFVDGGARVLEWIDLKIVNGAVNGVAFFTAWSGRTLRYTEDGQVQTYALYMVAGVMIILIAALCAVYTALA
jgi:NADH-quinone oxidoreductase subunit L